ncbi:MAG TPA: beta-L-arabinofuranosidase domain-containing protein [Kofleriaceae bacterium]|nr:beta-L-arabinofuranosidase domain-containing protein [Kofleriaceae bacterium]
MTLLDGPFKANMGRTMAYLAFVDTERMLHTFRLNVGLASSAAALGGWETPTTELRGHSMGHLLSGLAQAYANTGDTTLKAKGDYLVGELAKCQARASAAGFNTGYLSAYPENFFDRLEALQAVWAPYYTLHKIMAGLLDQFLLTGNQQALSVLTAKAGWVFFRTGRLSQTQMQSVLRTEFGGMAEVLVNLYQITGDPNHLTSAQRFDHAQIFDPLASNQDRLSGFHANTQIPKILAAIREYHQTGTARYRTIAQNFWDIVLAHHTYCIGGNSNGEFFQTPDAIASQLSDTTCEVCNTYNMLKLTRQLFFTDPTQTRYMDYYERGLFNQILGEQDPQSPHGFVTYYTPLRPGGIKTYANDYNNFTCDHGSGMESQTKFADSIFFRSTDTLYVNLFIASTVSWPEIGVTVRQDTAFPDQLSTRLTVTTSAPRALPIKIRVPSWVQPGYRLAINGAVQSVTATPGTYLTINRTWNNGDVVDVTMPAAIAVERTPDSATVQSVRFGGIVLAGAYGTTQLTSLPTLTPSSIQPTSTPQEFTAQANGAQVRLIPFYKMHHQRYTVYWNTGSNTPPPEVVAWYRFDETGGTSAADASGNPAGGPATLVGGASFGAGRVANALRLDGTSGYARLPSGLLSNVGDFTVSAWVNLAAATQWSRIFDFGSGTGSYMFLTPRSSAGTMRFAITTGGAGGEQVINGSSALATGAWKHVAVTATGTTGILYVDGAEVGRATISLRPSSLGSTTATFVGKSQYTADPFLNGQVDQLRIYSRAMSATEVRSLFQTP